MGRVGEGSSPAAPRPARTPRSSFELDGVGVHTGARCRARVGPAPFGAGIRFHPWDGATVSSAAASSAAGARGASVPAHVRWARAGEGSTVLERAGVVVRTPEHLLAALLGAGCTDARIDVFGPEIPIADGSAAAWADGLDAVGLVDGPELEPWVVRAPARIVRGESWAVAGPPAREGTLSVRVEVDFTDPADPGGDPSVPRGAHELDLVGTRLPSEVAGARTFVLARDVARLRAMGRGAGATRQNTLVVGGAESVPDPGEPVRHKLLDAIGDLALVGRPLAARVVIHRGGHGLHLALVEEICRQELRALFGDHRRR